MNLWAKSFGRLTVLAVALFFFSCKDESSLLGLKDPTSKFGVTYVEIPLTSSVMTIDSIYTDNKVATGGLLVGQYLDPRLGPMRAESYLQIIPASATVIPADAVFDSIMVQLRFNYYSYGLQHTKFEKFTIHEITGDTLSRLFRPRYSATSSIAYNPVHMAEASVFVDTDTLKKYYPLPAAQQDTLQAIARLSDEFGQRIFALAKQYTFQSNAEVIDFINQVKGLALIPSASEAILGIRILESPSSVVLHYHTVTDGTTNKLTRNFGFFNPSFSHIVADRSSTELSAITLPYRDFEPGSGLRYIQSGTPLITKLDLSAFYAFADPLENVVINEATLVINDVESPTGMNPHSLLLMKPMNNNNFFFSAFVPTERTMLNPYYAFPLASSDNFGSPNYGHYFVNSDLPSSSASAAEVKYNSDTRSYTGYMTLFVQTLFRNKNDKDGINDTRIKYLALYPGGPSVQHSVTRTVFSGSNVKLRIYYTRPTIDPNP